MDVEEGQTRDGQTITLMKQTRRSTRTLKIRNGISRFSSTSPALSAVFEELKQNWMETRDEAQSLLTRASELVLTHSPNESREIQYHAEIISTVKFLMKRASSSYRLTETSFCFD